MRKTTVYLSDEEAEALRLTATETGRSQAALIREGVRRVTRVRKRRFYSMGVGEGPGGQTPRWDPDELHREVMGRPAR